MGGGAVGGVVCASAGCPVTVNTIETATTHVALAIASSSASRTGGTVCGWLPAVQGFRLAGGAGALRLLRQDQLVGLRDPQPVLLAAVHDHQLALAGEQGRTLDPARRR